jgi:aspartate aminotransferase-like enzyme
MAGPILHHRTEEFRGILRECREGLREFFRTQDDVAILAASGTAGMEAALVNLLSPGDRVLVGSCGKFGDRWAEIAAATGIEASVLRPETGSALDPEQVAARVRDLRPRAFCTTASETSVGVKNPVETLSRVVREASPDTLVVVDAITALGAFPIETGRWELDAVVCASQKALSLPPGLAFVSLSARAREASRAAKLPRYYLDLRREMARQAEGETAFTPAIMLVVGLAASLQWFRERTLEGAWRDTARWSATTRAGLEALGVRFVPREAHAESVTAAWVPEGIDGPGLVRQLAEQSGIKIAGGQGELKTRIFRIAHFGPLSDQDALDCLEGIESILSARIGGIPAGAALGAAARVMGELR